MEIARAQQEDKDLQRKAEEYPNDLSLREGLIRAQTKRGERIVVPYHYEWKLVSRIHKYLLHFGTDKIVDFVAKYFHIRNIDKLVRDVVASCNTC